MVNFPDQLLAGAVRSPEDRHEAVRLFREAMAGARPPSTDSDTTNNQAAQDHKVPQDTQDPKEANTAEDPKGTKAAEDPKGANAAQDTKGANAAQDTEGANAAEDPKGTKAAEDPKEAKEAKKANAAQEPEQAKTANAAKEPEQAKAAKDPEEIKATKEAAITKDASDATATPYDWSTQDARDTLHKGTTPIPSVLHGQPGFAEHRQLVQKSDVNDPSTLAPHGLHELWDELVQTLQRGNRFSTDEWTLRVRLDDVSYPTTTLELTCASGDLSVMLSTASEGVYGRLSSELPAINVRLKEHGGSSGAFVQLVSLEEIES